MSATTLPAGASVYALARRVVARVGPRRASLTRRAFWTTQALVGAATVQLYVVDLLFHQDGIAGGMHDLPIMLFLLPVLYAALAFGLEGAVLTSLWCALLVAPHSIIVAGANFEWVGDVGTLAIVAVAGGLLALHVESEHSARLKAESVSRRLRFLNELAGVFDHPIPRRELLRELVERLRQNLQLDCAWVRYSPGSRAGESFVVAAAGPGQEDFEAEAVSATAMARLVNGPRAGIDAEGVDGMGDMVVAPLVVEGRVMGALGAMRLAAPLDADERGTLKAAAAQAAVTLENQELQRTHRAVLTSYARQVTNAQEEERRRIARELHDGPTQALTGLCRGLDLVQAELGGLEGVAETTRALRLVAEGAVADLRRLARDLRPRMLDDLGLVSAVEWLAEDLRERTNLDVHFSMTGQRRLLTGEQELGVFRIVQEALTNVEKHAHATRVAVLLDCTAGGVHVTIRDDGAGFDALADGSVFMAGGRYGILGMQERARLNNGTLRIESHLGAGTEVTLRVAWHEPAVPSPSP